MNKAISAAVAAGWLILGAGVAHADPAPAPPVAPGLSPEAAQAYQRAYQDWMDAPCGPSIDPNPIPHIRVKFCDPNGQPVTHP
jgi:hypothetical protein